MKTVVLGPPPSELEALLARRRARREDLFDETDASSLLGISVAQLVARIDWPG